MYCLNYKTVISICLIYILMQFWYFHFLWRWPWFVEIYYPVNVPSSH